MTKKYPTISDRVFRIKAWRCPTLTWGDPTLPSAQSSFTSEFEMGSGGSYLLLPPDKLVEERSDETIPSASEGSCSTTLFETGKPNTLGILNVLYSSVTLISHPDALLQSKNAWGYMVKPYGQLVQVSFTHYCASTPCLSTS